MCKRVNVISRPSKEQFAELVGTLASAQIVSKSKICKRIVKGTITKSGIKNRSRTYQREIIKTLIY